MAIQTNPTRDYLCALALRLDSAGHGGRGALIDEAANLYDWSTAKVYKELERQAGWTSGRKARADKGSSRQSMAALTTVAALTRGSVRQNDKQTMHTPVAASIALQNGCEISVSPSQLNRLMATRRLSVSRQQSARASVQLRSLYPNHVHQADPSLCLVYYLRGQQHIIRDDEFYKNKLDKLAKVQFKCWRYVLTDHASGSVIPWYVEAAGESPLNLFRFLMFAWGEQAGRTIHGVPKILMWDKGSANTASSVQNVLTALEVESITHAAGNAQAKGGVENGNNLVETQFECRLRYDPVDGVEALNRAATQWAEAYCANALPGQDTRLRREGIPPIARYDLWRLIRQEQLRLLPDEEVCQAFLEGRTETRKVSKNLELSFAHPKAGKSRKYDVGHLAGVCAGDTVEIAPLLYGECAISIRVPNYKGEDLRYRLEPVSDETDQFGRPLSAPVIGERYASRPETDADRAGKVLDAALFPGLDAVEIERAKRKNTTPFGGEMNAVRYLADVAVTASLPKRGTEIALQAAKFEPTKLPTVEAARRLLDLGCDQPYAWLLKHRPEGVTEDELPDVARAIKGTPALRVVAG
ncbi:MAG: hypothetical protein RIR00_1010 [Pseudomonadota bacterium]|jgi:transposase InsO family protein